jgi:hypothetical protein
MDDHSSVPLGSSCYLAAERLQPLRSLGDVEYMPVVVRPCPVHPTEGKAAHGQDRAKPQPDLLCLTVHKVAAEVDICAGAEVILD